MPSELAPPRVVVEQEVAGSSTTQSLPSLPTVLIGPNYQIEYRKNAGSYVSSGGTYNYPDLESGATLDTNWVTGYIKFTPEMGAGTVTHTVESSDITPGSSNFVLAGNIKASYVTLNGTNGQLSSRSFSSAKTAVTDGSCTNGSTLISSSSLSASAAIGDLVIIHAGTSLDSTDVGIYVVTGISGSPAGVTVSRPGWSSFGATATNLIISLWDRDNETSLLTGPSTIIGNAEGGDYIVLSTGTIAGTWYVGTPYASGSPSTHRLPVLPVVYYSTSAASFGGNAYVTVTGANFDDIVRVGDKLIAITSGSSTIRTITGVKPYRLDLDGTVAGTSHFVVVRNFPSSTGVSYSLYHTQFISTGTVYVTYRALKTSGTSNVVQINTEDDIVSQLGTQIPDNPLAFAAGLALSASDRPFYVMRVATDDSSGYSTALSNLESVDIYNVVPLTHDTSIHTLIYNHVISMSNTTNQKERAAYINRALYIKTTRSSGSSGTFSDADTFDDAGATFATDGVGSGDNLYLTYTDPDGYELTQTLTVNSATETQITLASSFSDWQDYNNGSNQTYTVYSTPLTETQQAEYLQSYAQTFATQRIRLVWPDYLYVDYSVDESGDDDSYSNSTSYTDQSVEGFYATSVIAAMRSSEDNPSTIYNFKIIPGFNNTLHSNDYFSYTDLNVIAAGGILILENTNGSSPVTIREQLTTDLSSDAYSQISNADSIDYGAKYIRDQLNLIVGRHKINGFYRVKLRNALNSTFKYLIDNEIWKDAAEIALDITGNNTSITIGVTLYGINRLITVTLVI